MVDALLHYLQILVANMGVGLEGILRLQELDDRVLGLVWVRECTEFSLLLCLSSFV